MVKFVIYEMVNGRNALNHNAFVYPNSRSSSVAFRSRDLDISIRENE